MRVEVGEKISYESERLWPPPIPVRLSASCIPTGDYCEMEPGSLEHFLIERYSLFSKKGSLYTSSIGHIVSAERRL